jgi:hypothetical protein
MQSITLSQLLRVSVVNELVNVTSLFVNGCELKVTVPTVVTVTVIGSALQGVENANMKLANSRVEPRRKTYFRIK